MPPQIINFLEKIKSFELVGEIKTDWTDQDDYFKINNFMYKLNKRQEISFKPLKFAVFFHMEY